MKRNQPHHIVCFALPAWEAPYLRSTVELMKGLALNNKVLYVNYAYSIKDCLNAILGKNKIDWKRLIGLKSRLQNISGNNDKGLYLLSLPPIIPAFATRNYQLFQLICKINAFITGFYINRAIKQLKMSEIVGFNAFQPFMGRYWKINNLVKTLYYIYDDFTNVPWFNGFVPLVEKEFIKKVDLVIVTSDELKKRNLGYGLPIEVIHNGVHFNAFNKHMNSGINSGNTVGYTGSVDNRIDIALLEPVVSAMPEVNFLFIGKIFDQGIPDRLSHYPNVQFQPPVPSEEIPQLQSKLQAGIVPYVRNPLTAAIYPLKVNEYLAMGLPVIMTPFASVGEADEVVYTAVDSETFRQGIQQALAENDPGLNSKRVEVAKNADWGARVQQLERLITSYKAHQL